MHASRVSCDKMLQSSDEKKTVSYPNGCRHRFVMICSEYAHPSQQKQSIPLIRVHQETKMERALNKERQRVHCIYNNFIGHPDHYSHGTQTLSDGAREGGERDRNSWEVEHRRRRR